MHSPVECRGLRCSCFEQFVVLPCLRRGDSILVNLTPTRPHGSLALQLWRRGVCC